MAMVCVVIFVALYFVDAGYGKMRSEKWGPAINNKVGWFLMEAPVFVVSLVSVNRSFSGPIFDIFPYFSVALFSAFFRIPILAEGKFKDADYHYVPVLYMERYQWLSAGILAISSGACLCSL